MKILSPPIRPRRVFVWVGVWFVATSFLSAASDSQNPVSKFFVADLIGDADVILGEKIVPLKKKSVFNAQDTVIETKSRANNSLVYSNGTGMFVDENTRIELRRFAQEPFRSDRIDIETEPSISQTQAFVSHGSVGLCTGKMVAGSSMTYQTPLASVDIRGRRIVIESGEDETKISMIEGDSTVRGGDLDLRGYTVNAGEQAVVRRGSAGQPNPVIVQKIPEVELGILEDKSSVACVAKQTVYFDVRPSTPPDATIPNSSTRLEIVPVEIVPRNLPVKFTVSPSRL